VDLNLYPDSFTGANLLIPINRADFCALAVSLYETVTGTAIMGRVTFDDTNDVNVEKAAYLGLITGTSSGTFTPNAQITREQFATLLVRLAGTVIGTPLPAQEPNFSDNGDISAWAYAAVGQVQALGIMSDVGDGRFAPQEPLTREQSIVSMLRLYLAIAVV